MTERYNSTAQDIATDYGLSTTRNPQNPCMEAVAGTQFAQAGNVNSVYLCHESRKVIPFSTSSN